MDWENPLRSIAATVDADVLKVLAGAHEPVTGNQLARLAGRSYAQVYAVVGRMVDEGLVLTTATGEPIPSSSIETTSWCKGFSPSSPALPGSNSRSSRRFRAGACSPSWLQCPDRRRGGALQRTMTSTCSSFVPTKPIGTILRGGARLGRWFEGSSTLAETGCRYGNWTSLNTRLRYPAEGPPAVRARASRGRSSNVAGEPERDVRSRCSRANDGRRCENHLTR